jgi:hypothetical protein
MDAAPPVGTSAQVAEPEDAVPPVESSAQVAEASVPLGGTPVAAAAEPSPAEGASAPPPVTETVPLDVIK